MTPTPGPGEREMEEIRRWLPTESYVSSVPNDPRRCDNCGGFWASDWHREGRIDQNGRPRDAAEPDDFMCATAAAQMLLAHLDTLTREHQDQLAALKVTWEAQATALREARGEWDHALDGFAEEREKRIRAEQRVAGLEAALKPFAERADYFEGRLKADGEKWRDEDYYVDDPPSDIYLRQLRAARALLTPPPVAPLTMTTDLPPGMRTMISSCWTHRDAPDWCGAHGQPMPCEGWTPVAPGPRETEDGHDDSAADDEYFDRNPGRA